MKYIMFVCLIIFLSTGCQDATCNICLEKLSERYPEAQITQVTNTRDVFIVKDKLGNIRMVATEWQTGITSDILIFPGNKVETPQPVIVDEPVDEDSLLFYKWK